MWQTIFTASLMVTIMRMFPAFISSVERIKDNPKLSKYFDYTICLITGEVIYSIAYKDLPSDDTQVFYYILTTLSILLAAILMWRTAKLSKSLILGLGLFIVGYGIFNI